MCVLHASSPVLSGLRLPHLEHHGEVDTLAAPHPHAAHVEVAEDGGGRAHGVVVRADDQAGEGLQRRHLVLQQGLQTKSTETKQGTYEGVSVTVVLTAPVKGSGS